MLLMATSSEYGSVTCVAARAATGLCVGVCVTCSDVEVMAKIYRPLECGIEMCTCTSLVSSDSSYDLSFFGCTGILMSCYCQEVGAQEWPTNWPKLTTTAPWCGWYVASLSLSLSLSLQKTVEWRCHHAIFVLCAVLVGINFAFWRMCKFDCACACHLFILSVHVQLQSFLPLHRHCAVFNAVHCLQLAFPGSFTMPFTSGRVWHRVARD